MTITEKVIKNIIRKLIAGQDYRIEIVGLIDAEFLQYVIDFFSRVVTAKLKNQKITGDWYKKELLDPALSSQEIAINSGLNMKTIHNMYNSSTRSIVIDASTEHYEALYKIIKDLTEQAEIDIKLTIKFRDVSADLDVNESLIVINTIAVKRAALRGGLWSTAGKQVEKPLMRTLCELFKVPELHFDQSRLPESLREVDFYLIDKKSKYHRCEVKLMGKGNPESADAVIARDTDVFVADKLSDTNKKQLDGLKVQWVELRSQNGYKKLEKVLKKLSIPYTPFKGDLHKALDNILSKISDEEVQGMAANEPDAV